MFIKSQFWQSSCYLNVRTSDCNALLIAGSRHNCNDNASYLNEVPGRSSENTRLTGRQI